MVEPSGLGDIELKPLATYRHKVSLKEFAEPIGEVCSFSDFLRSVPNILAGRELREVAEAIVNSRKQGFPVIFLFGAHVVKCGLSRVVIQLMEAGVVTHLATNGAGAIHDVEIALVGHTSEDVDSAIEQGVFGLARETSEVLNEAAREAARTGEGYGEAIGRLLHEKGAPNLVASIFARAYELPLPVTVHVAIGADTFHLHPNCDPAALGEATHTDFRRLITAVSDLYGGGVVVNIGSAVQLPATLQKAFAAVRAKGKEIKGFVGVNLDFIRHYRPNLDPVHRAKQFGGKGYNLTGRHEIMIPLLAWAILERLGKTGKQKDMGYGKCDGEGARSL